MVERRSTIRAVVRIQIYDQDSRAERVPLFVAGNVSAGGLFLITQEPYPPGTNLKIVFSLPGESRFIEAMGTVIWSRLERQAPERQPGMGVQFMQIKEEDRQRIRSFVHAQSEVEEAQQKKDQQ